MNSIGSITEKNSTFVDEHLRKFTPRIPSYVKDITHFINIKKIIQLDPKDLFVTIDVSSLYTNIPHTEGIPAINRMMEETGTDTLLKMFISNLTQQVLTKNYFNGKLYEQIQWTAMGTRMAPNYAIIFMHYLETNFLSNYPKQPKIWLRFIDDIFMIWKEWKLELDKFLETQKSYHQTIKFMHTIDENENLSWTQWYIDQLLIESTLESSINQLIKNIIYTQLNQKKTRKIMSLMAFWSDAEEFVQKITTLNKKLKNYTINWNIWNTQPSF